VDGCAPGRERKKAYAEVTETTKFAEKRGEKQIPSLRAAKGAGLRSG
jgi:predicted RNase H-like nuclease